MHQPYCWQVGLHQSLLPLQIDKCIVSIKVEKVTNHFSVHYLFKEDLIAKKLAEVSSPLKNNHFEFRARTIRENGLLYIRAIYT
jgi:hypothetical protein